MEQSPLAQYLDKFFKVYQAGRWDATDFDDLYELGLMAKGIDDSSNEALAIILSWKSGDLSEQDMVTELKEVRASLN